jgi:hypothetical protein
VERAVQEVNEHILRLDLCAQAISPLMLARAIASVNSVLRSSREMLTQRDQFTNHQLPVSDRDLLSQKHLLRPSNHSSSEKYKTPSGLHPKKEDISIGDLVYIYADRNKSKARDRYLVVSTDTEWCNIRKFTGRQLRQASYRIKKSECYLLPCQSHDRYTRTDPKYSSSADS